MSGTSSVAVDCYRPIGIIFDLGHLDRPLSLIMVHFEP